MSVQVGPVLSDRPCRCKGAIAGRCKRTDAGRCKEDYRCKGSRSVRRTHVGALALQWRESVWRSGRYGSPDRARRLWGACQLTELAPAAGTRPRSAVRPPESDSRRSNANAATHRPATRHAAWRTRASMPSASSRVSSHSTMILRDPCRTEFAKAGAMPRWLSAESPLLAAGANGHQRREPSRHAPSDKLRASRA